MEKRDKNIERESYEPHYDSVRDTLLDAYGNYAGVYMTLYDLLLIKRPRSIQLLLTIGTLSAFIGKSSQFTLPPPKDAADADLLSAFRKLTPHIELKLQELQKFAKENPVIEGEDWPTEKSVQWTQLLVELKTLLKTWYYQLRPEDRPTP